MMCERKNVQEQSKTRNMLGLFDDTLLCCNLPPQLAGLKLCHCAFLRFFGGFMCFCTGMLLLLDQLQPCCRSATNTIRYESIWSMHCHTCITTCSYWHPKTNGIHWHWNLCSGSLRVYSACDKNQPHRQQRATTSRNLPHWPCLTIRRKSSHALFCLLAASCSHIPVVRLTQEHWGINLPLLNGKRLGETCFAILIGFLKSLGGLRHLWL